MTSAGFSRFAAYSVFEGLRPDDGQNLDRAAFATYSLDLVAVAALVLSLGRAGEQELEAGPLALVDAIEAVASRIDIVHQADRLKATSRHFGILHLLDRRLHAIRPSPGSSFHPKMALVRYIGPHKKISWRLWIGSRNLTGGQDREAGLLLVGRIASRGRVHLPAIGRMCADLLEPVGWVASLSSELEAVRWRAPEGVGLRGIQWRRAGEERPFATSMRGTTRSVAISPFIDDHGLTALDEGDLLLTTADGAAGLSHLSGVSVTTCRPPIYDVAMAAEPPEAAPAIDDVSVPEPSGVHAKLLLRRGLTADRLWIGSANLTRRGMAGRNAELLVELDVPPATADALEAFALDGESFHAADLCPDPGAGTKRAAERALDDALAAVTGAEFELRREEQGLMLGSQSSLDGFLLNHRLEAWLLTRPDTRTCWQAGATSTLLVPGGIAIRWETVLVCFRAQRLANDCGPRTWAQAVSFPAHDPEARDRAATAAYIGLAGASAWLRAQLAGSAGPEATTWTGARRWPGSEFAGATDGVPLALEEVLAAWARDPDTFEDRACRLGGTLTALEAELAATPPDERDDEAVARWSEVVDFWTSLRATIEVPA